MTSSTSSLESEARSRAYLDYIDEALEKDENLKALKKDIEYAEAQLKMFKELVLWPIFNEHPKIIGRWHDAEMKVMENHRDLVLPKVRVHAKAKCELTWRLAGEYRATEAHESGKF